MPKSYHLYLLDFLHTSQLSCVRAAIIFPLPGPRATKLRVRERTMRKLETQCLSDPRAQFVARKPCLTMEAEHGGCKSGSDPSSSSRQDRQNSRR